DVALRDRALGIPPAAEPADPGPDPPVPRRPRPVVPGLRVMAREAKEQAPPNGLAVAERVWEGLPRWAKDGAKGTWAGYARLTSRSRLLPDYIIIGTQRAGTTSLYKYLVRHPAVGHALTKELRFFDLHYDKGVPWYRSRFPSARHRAHVERTKGHPLL